MLTLAKRAGISFQELALMSMNEFLEYIEVYFSDSEDEEAVRDATTDDIERMLL